MVYTINQSFSEVYDIMMHLETGLLDKIPQKFINMIEENRDMRISSKYRLYSKYQ